MRNFDWIITIHFSIGIWISYVYTSETGTGLTEDSLASSDDLTAAVEDVSSGTGSAVLTAMTRAKDTILKYFILKLRLININ